MAVDFEAFGVEEYTQDGEQKTRWTNIGVAFLNKDSISIHLNAYPTNPKIVLMKPRPKEEEKPKMDVFPPQA